MPSRTITAAKAASQARPNPPASSREIDAMRYFALVCDQSLSAASVFSTCRLGFRLW